MLPRFRTNHIIFLGFAMILVIMAVLTTIWLQHISNNTHYITDIVKDQEKVEHVFTMRDAASQRALSLYRMSVLTDPFEQDDEYLKFRKQAENFIKARLALVEIGENEEEKVAWKNAQPLVQKGTINQTRVAELIADGDISQANDLMINSVIPNQNAVLQHLTGMLDLQKAHVFVELDEVTKQNGRVYLQISILGSLAFIIGVIITFFVLKTSTRNQQKLILAQQESHEANQHKSAFLANMSHELRTPLNAIIGYSEMLHEEASENKQDIFADDLSKIRGSGQHLLSLINDILDVSKIEAGKMELYTESFNLSMLVEEVSNTLQPLLAKNDNDLHFTLGDFDVEMHTDLTKLRQTLFNLLSNANKFTLQGQIRLSIATLTVQNQPWVEISVKDSGIGMDTAQMEKLFAPFTQANASTTRNFGGTGLGLTISKRFCEMMGGTITVASQPNAGSTFTITLPTTFASDTQHVA